MGGEWCFMKNFEDLITDQYKNVELILNDNAFEEFYNYMKNNINPDMNKYVLIDFITQYILLEPVFDMLFVSSNKITIRLKNITSFMKENNLVITNKGLENIYADTNKKVCDIKTQEDKQTIIIETYNTFFKNACKDKCELHGIVFTPVEIVDFIIHSIEDVLNKYFDKSIGDEGIHILDPFTGTGTFIVRLLQSGLISKEDLLRKYMNEIHANEIVLLSYYIAAINIEETFHSITDNDYKPFDGIVLTDTFESTEKQNSFDDELFGENNERLQKQNKEPVFVIFGNPPYSVGKKSANDSIDFQSYPKLEESIEKTYGVNSKAKLKRALNDSYIKAFRWSSDRIKNKGVIGFVTNGSFIDSQVTDGLRKCWHREFNYIYILNLRGDQRTQGEISRKEGGKVFGSGSRTPIAITLLIKDGSDEHKIFYHDIGDYLSREDKLEIISTASSIKGIQWREIIPDENNDWINQRDSSYDAFIPLYEGIFDEKLVGVSTSRDAWVYGYSKNLTTKKAQKMVDNYNDEVDRLKDVIDKDLLIQEANSSLDYINWSSGLRNRLVKKEKITLNNKVVSSMYRPFVKKWLYYDKQIVERPGRSYSLFDNIDNRVIYCTGIGAKRDFSCIMTNVVPNYDMMEKGQGFFLNKESIDNVLFTNTSNIIDVSLSSFGLNKEELFYYIYAVLHSVEYREKYANDLKKALPRIPVLKNKNQYVEIGRSLAELHLNYEKVEPYSNIIVEGKKNPSYKVIKMKHPKKGMLDTIVFNADLTITNIPEKAYNYVVNGKPAIEWIIDQYQIKVDKGSGIIDDPNLYSEDEHYIFDLLLRIINVSIKTVDLVNSLPPLELEE